MSGKRVAGLLVLMVLSVLGWKVASAQNTPPPRSDKARAQEALTRFQQRVLENVKKELGSTDDEFKVLQPRILKILELQFQSRAIGNRGMFGRARGPAASIVAALPPSDVQKTATALQEVLDRKDSKPDDIKARLSDLRQARAVVREQLVQAQEDLRELLTIRQEATLVMMGILE